MSTINKTDWADENYSVNGKSILIINLYGFKEIMKTSSDLQSVVRIFLKPVPPENLEAILKKLLASARDDDVNNVIKKLELLFYKFQINGPSDLQLIIRIVSRLIDNLQVENPEILRKIPDLANIPELIVKSRSDYFDARLTEFELRINEL